MIKSFPGVQGAKHSVFQKSPLTSGGTFVFFIFFLFFQLHAGDSPITRADQLKKQLAVSLDNCLKSKIYHNVEVGIQVNAVDGEQALYRRNEKKPYTPASAIKIFISAVSLSKFGPGYQFETPLLADGSLANGILKGNLYLQGRGDPSLLYTHLEQAAKQLKTSGIDIIEGNVVYDIAFLEEVPPRYPPNARHFYSPPGALTVNYNWVDLELQEGPPPKLKTIPQTAYARLDYKIHLSRSQNPGRPAMTYREMPWGDQYTIRGTVTEWDKRYKYLCLCVSRPGLFGATLLKEACEKTGIKIT
ncbi:MAG TPA: D-alanyl-D-alanine carboxypeptidase, partial [Candidatus Deferrimicrobium sp.]|nr:D-alanyl-D-alanine carboxypeptidase [Candidatus Deferrimicrobium sp.]